MQMPPTELPQALLPWPGLTLRMLSSLSKVLLHLKQSVNLTFEAERGSHQLNISPIRVFLALYRNFCASVLMHGPLVLFYYAHINLWCKVLFLLLTCISISQKSPAPVAAFKRSALMSLCQRGRPRCAHLYTPRRESPCPCSRHVIRHRWALPSFKAHFDIASHY